MSETRILISLLQMYIPRNWEFGQAFSKLRNFGGFEPPQHPRGYASGSQGCYILGEFRELLCSMYWRYIYEKVGEERAPMASPVAWL
jgi:hypothetical protein